MEELMVAPKNAVETVTFISEVMVAVLLLNSRNVPIFQLQVQRQASSSLILWLTLSTGNPFDSNPPEDEHGAVMVDVEEADLVELLPQYEKDSVQELHSFGDVVPPKSRGYLKI